METIEHVHRTVPGKGEVTVKIERGAKGGLSWEIRVAGPVTEDAYSTGQELVEIVAQLEADIKSRFGGE